MAELKPISIKSKIGIFFVVIGFICPIFGLVVPLLGLSAGLTTSLAAFFMVGGPEVFLIIGAALAGKEGVLLVKNRFKRMVGLPEGRYAATRSQYTIGLVLIVFWFMLTIASGYIPGFFDMDIVQDNLLWFSIGADLLFIVAIFGFGGHQMITKIANVFTWEEWELPPEKEK